MRAGISAAAAAAVLAAAVSLVATLVAGGRPDLLVLVEAVVMIVLIFLAVRKAPARQALFAASVVGAAEAAMILDAGSSLREGAEAVAFWALAAAGAAGAALHLNALDAQRARSVADARRSQRLELARDLHDFVAHDVSGIVVDAQAGRTVGVDAPEQALAALERIEKDALRALASMDRTVRALREATGPEQAQTAGLEDLAELTGRFATSSRAQVQLDVAPEALDGLAPEVSATGYRVVVEALSNVRRHAPAAGGVEVAVAPVREGIAVTVTNDGVGANGRADDRDAGFGLIGLRERVEALGGSVSAGPVDADGWRLTAVMPCGDGRRP